MKVKLEWLNELVDLSGLEVSEIVRKLSLYSVEVEGVSKVIDASNIVIGHVLTKVKHPDSDHLNVLTVDVKSEILQIVCGASNVDVDQYVVVALVGAVLPGNFQIKKSKIRGVESFGMVCSLQELGVDKKYISPEYSEGIYYFKEPVEIGSDAKVALNLHDDVIELGLTPNRGDLLSLIGVAYEASSVFNRPLKQLVYKYTKSSLNEKINLKLESSDCLSYYAQVVKNVQIKPSPTWLKSRLIAFGIRPINNVVDITNYILVLFGQPLHAFDYDKLGKNIVVRNAKQNEEIITLDGIKRNLIDTDIVITDGQKPVALAGVMGGLDTEVTEATKNLVIEVACFKPLVVRQTSSRLGLRSESSVRFERGVDINRMKAALDYTNYLLTQLANGEISSEVTFEGLEKVDDKKIVLTECDVEKRLGIKITKEEIIKILNGLSFEVNENLEVLVPNRRPDITIKEDLIEEIGRIYGYENLKITLPVDNMVGYLSERQKTIRKIKTVLSQAGLYETYTYSLVSSDQNNLFTYNHPENIEPIRLLMPLSEDRSTLRFGLIPSLIEVVKYNLQRKIENVGIFEVGKVYYKQEDYTEETYLGGALVNTFSSTLWKQQVEHVDFFLVKGILDTLFTNLGYKLNLLPLDKESNELHPKRSAKIIVNDVNVGFIGQVHPMFALQNDLDDVYVFEINLDRLLGISKQPFTYSQISKLPSVERDIAVVVKKNILSKELIDSIYKSDKELLSDVTVFDVYEGDKIGSDEKSIALKLVFTSDIALTDEVINNKIKRILKDLNFKFGAQLRN